MNTLKNLQTSDHLNEITVKYQTKQKPSEMKRIISSADCFEVFKRVFNPDSINYSEECVLLLLNSTSGLIGWVKVSTGGIAGTVIDQRIIFVVALQTGASAIMLAHNHPSGNLAPSQADINMTKKIVEAGLILNIPLLDHLIITEENYYSFANEGEI